MADRQRLIADALRALGVRNLVLGIQDPSFPSTEGEDTGRGSPCSEGGKRFLRFLRDLGFNGVQLGPQGQTSESNPSPYDGTIFSRNTLSIALPGLAEDPRWGGLLHRERVASIVASKPPGSRCKVQHRYAFRAQREALREAFEAFATRRARGGSAPGDVVASIAERLDAFRQRHEGWLTRDALYEQVCREHEGAHWRSWARAGEASIDQRLWSPDPGEELACERRRQELVTRYAGEIERYAFCQLIAHEQHDELRAVTAGLGLKLYGDLQIGYSEQDVWSYQSVFLRSYLMGAPPSRTNPEGQAWNYPVFDPDQYFDGPARAPGAVLRLLSARMDKLFSEFDGIRIDHPHGLVCPWVYRAGAPDTLAAVRGGARLFCSPNLPDHPGLARYAIPEEAQINYSAPRHADDWVRDLTADQVRRYGALFDAVTASARKNGRPVADLVCEVLSTLPYPLARVLKEHGLGRFRVTQKANLRDPADVYRSENAAPEDWIMVGNHDTKPIWLLVDQWWETGAARGQAEYLAARLLPDGAGRTALFAELTTDPGALAQAKFADLFASRAENVMIFFSDLLGVKEVFNSPGVVNDANWCLRVPNDYEEDYAEKLAHNGALNLPKVLAMAIRARGGDFTAGRRELIEGLEAAGASHRSRVG